MTCYPFHVGYILSIHSDKVIVIVIEEGTKIRLLLDFNNQSKSVRDPWYYDCYDETYCDVVTGCTAFLKYLKTEGKI